LGKWEQKCVDNRKSKHIIPKILTKVNEQALGSQDSNSIWY
jgi:hypothetical protein